MAIGTAPSTPERGRIVRLPRRNVRCQQALLHPARRGHDGRQHHVDDVSAGLRFGLEALDVLPGIPAVHHVLDDWFERTVKQRLRGRCQLVRYV